GPFCYGRVWCSASHCSSTGLVHRTWRPLMQPGDRAFDDPAARGAGLLAGIVELLFAAAAEVRHVPGAGADTGAGLLS
ncbi:MAG: hypothetical protein ACRDL4_08190, partial [Thermoleophilaceae bacterium]